MGTTGSGNFSDYPGGSQRPNTGSGSGGGHATETRCDQAFSVALEDVARSDYYLNNGDVPAPGTALTITHEKRLVARTENGLAVGNIPTEKNYLAACLESGYTYTGDVTDSSNSPVPTVSVDFAPASTP